MDSGLQSLSNLVKDALSMLTDTTGYSVVTWFLAYVFAWSGVVKLRRPFLAAMAIADFGITRRVHPSLGQVLGAAEMLLAFTLAAKVYPQVTLLITAMLLWFFTAIIARSLWLGQDFACFCFGDNGSTLSRWTLARTTALAILTTVLTSISAPALAGVSVENAMQALVALAALGSVVLIGTMPRLLKWRQDALSNRS